MRKLSITAEVERLINAYLDAKIFVIGEGYYDEIDWQEDISFEQINESDFLREAAWVILSSGMRESVIRKKFGEISNAFFQWKSATHIVLNSQKCLEEARKHFNNTKKLESIVIIARQIYLTGFTQIKYYVELEGIDYLSRFPYMGPATSYHFAKNIGICVAKPDRHLIRIAEKAGYSSPQLLCTEISKAIDEKVSVIDLVFWRYATLQRNYLDLFNYQS